MENKYAERRSALMFHLLLCAVSFGFLAVFSFYTSPFTTCDNGADSAFFCLVGRGMTKGYLPYRDFFDMKGPFLFFIEYLGQLLSYGRWGIFLLQCLNLFLSLAIACRIFALYGVSGRRMQLALLLPLLYVASFTFEGGNLTEEFSLVPLLLCLLFCLRFFACCEEPARFWRDRMFLAVGALFGFCFGLLLMIRVTNASLICAMAVTVLAALILAGKLRQLILCAGMFLAGLMVSVAPALLFFRAKGLLKEMLEAVFVLGFRYSGEKTFAQHVVQMINGDRRQQILLVLIPCAIVFLLHWRSWRERLFVFLGSVFSFYVISAGNNYSHYYTLTIPLLVLGEASLVDSFHTKSRARTVLALVLAGTMLVSQFGIAQHYAKSAGAHLFSPERFQTALAARDISSRIPDSDRDSVFGYNIHPAWYTYADLFPCIKYCGWQNHYISLMPQIYDDLQERFETQPPRWLVLPAGKSSLPAFLSERLESSYSLYHQNDSYRLLQLIDTGSAPLPDRPD